MKLRAAHRHVAWLLTVVGATILLGAPLEAQDQSAGKRIWSRTADCTRCHGWAGDGSPAGPGFPVGANLRLSTITREAFIETVMCGRPGTEMPSFGRGAWTTYSCFGLTAEQVGAARPPADATQLSNEQIATLADYAYVFVVGRGPITRADCEAYFGAGAARCALY